MKKILEYENKKNIDNHKIAKVFKLLDKSEKIINELIEENNELKNDNERKQRQIMRLEKKLE